MTAIVNSIVINYSKMSLLNPTLLYDPEIPSNEIFQLSVYTLENQINLDKLVFDECPNVIGINPFKQNGLAPNMNIDISNNSLITKDGLFLYRFAPDIEVVETNYYYFTSNGSATENDAVIRFSLLVSNISFNLVLSTSTNAVLQSVIETLSDTNLIIYYYDAPNSASTRYRLEQGPFIVRAPTISWIANGWVRDLEAYPTDFNILYRFHPIPRNIPKTYIDQISVSWVDQASDSLTSISKEDFNDTFNAKYYIAEEIEAAITP